MTDQTTPAAKPAYDDGDGDGDDEEKSRTLNPQMMPCPNCQRPNPPCDPSNCPYCGGAREVPEDEKRLALREDAQAALAAMPPTPTDLRDWCASLTVKGIYVRLEGGQIAITGPADAVLVELGGPCPNCGSSVCNHAIAKLTNMEMSRRRLGSMLNRKPEATDGAAPDAR